MPVAKPRRLLAPAGPSLYQRLSREALSCAYSERELADVERLHPQLVVERDGDALTAIQHGEAIVLPYAFASSRSFADNFETMFNELLPLARRAYDADTVRFRLTHGSARPTVEPILRRLWFSPKKAWFQFSLPKAATSPKVASPKGVKFRPGNADDVDALLAIDRNAFPNTPVTRDGLLAMLEGTGRVLVAERAGVPVGFALYDHDTPGTGYLRTLAVLDEARGQGIGASLTLRTARVLFGEGAMRLALRTDDDNANAIRLYTWLGFRHAGAGRDYERPADPRVIEAMRKENEGTFIKFGKWR
jgi:ribosomal protein S18 acetylase RimI-like enzyme